jgi:hypothetical protein
MLPQFSSILAVTVNADSETQKVSCQANQMLAAVMVNRTCTGWIMEPQFTSSTSALTFVV